MKLIDYKTSPDRKYVYIILEYCSEGTIKSWLEKRNNDVSATAALEILKQFINGYKYMMSISEGKNKLFVHRDIKSENVLVHKGINGKDIFKLADFGFSRSISKENDLMTSILGTPLYMCP